MRTERRIHGQALSEALLGMVVLVPILLLLPYIGKYLDVKHKAQDAGRYALWERTVFSDGGSWGAGENSKSAATIAREIDQRLLGDPSVAINETNTTSNPLWVDHTGGELVSVAERQATLAIGEDPFDYGLAGIEFLGFENNFSLVTALASDGLPLLNELDGLSSLLGGILDFNLGLNDRGFAETRISLPATDLPEFLREGVVNSATVSSERLNLAATGAILTDAWVPGSEANQVERLDGLVIDEITALLVLPGTITFGLFPAFIEGLDGFNPTLESESKVIPPRYLEPQD